MDVSQLLSGSHGGPVQDDIVPGERVRSYDFGVVRNCYIEGIVDAITDPMEGCHRYKLRIQVRVIDGQSVPFDQPFAYPPVNGTPSSMGGVTSFVERVSGLTPETDAPSL